MPAVYDTPITTPDETGQHVARVELDYDNQIVRIVLKRDPDGAEEPVRVGSQADVDSGRAEFTFAQFLTFLPRAASLNTDIEQKFVDIGRIPPSTVA